MHLDSPRSFMFYGGNDTYQLVKFYNVNGHKMPVQKKGEQILPTILGFEIPFLNYQDFSWESRLKMLAVRLLTAQSR